MSSNKQAGIALILGAIATVFVVALHPSGASSDPRGNAMVMGVHGLAIAAEILTVLGMLAFTVRLASQRSLSISAFAVYVFGIVALVFAAVNGGFIVPRLAVNLPADPGSARDAGLAVLRYTDHLSQALGTLGFVLVAVAIGVWSVALVRGGFARALGIYGMALAVIVLSALAISDGHLHMHGLGGLVAGGQLVWFLWAGVRLASAEASP